MKKRISDYFAKTAELRILISRTILQYSNFIFAPDYQEKIKIPVSMNVANFKPL
jgi:hypothetical protein